VVFDVISVGEALVEVMRPRSRQPLDRPGDLVGPFASGAPAIFAVAAARLGARTGFVSGLGRDAFGRLMLQRLGSEGVDTTGIQVMPDRTTGIAFVAYESDGTREFVFHLRYSAAGAVDPEKISLDYFRGVRWLHMSGSALMISDLSRDACAKSLRLARKVGAKFSFDPNLRPELMPVEQARELLRPFVDEADLLLPTAEEARILADREDDDTAAGVLLGNRDRIVAVKKGAQGCKIYSKEGVVVVDGLKVQEVDPTGAGDCFGAAFVVGLLGGRTLEATAKYANAAAALAVTKQGPMEGAPTSGEVQLVI